MASQEQETCVQNTEAQRIKMICRLNDQLRCRGKGGQLFISCGICDLKTGLVPLIVKAVAEFDDFTQGNDPYNEHDFGSLTFDGNRVFWKIDYYDKSMECGSPDPADPDVTSRVLTIFLASEY